MKGYSTGCVWVCACVRMSGCDLFNGNLVSLDTINVMNIKLCVMVGPTDGYRFVYATFGKLDLISSSQWRQAVESERFVFFGELLYYHVHVYSAIFDFGLFAREPMEEIGATNRHHRYQWTDC